MSVINWNSWRARAAHAVTTKLAARWIRWAIGHVRIAVSPKSIVQWGATSRHGGRRTGAMSGRVRLSIYQGRPIDWQGGGGGRRRAPTLRIRWFVIIIIRGAVAAIVQTSNQLEQWGIEWWKLLQEEEEKISNTNF